MNIRTLTPDKHLSLDCDTYQTLDDIEKPQHIRYSDNTEYSDTRYSDTRYSDTRYSDTRYNSVQHHRQRQRQRQHQHQQKHILDSVAYFYLIGLIFLTIPILLAR